jgi:cobalt-zinc-cadmium efflux system protein
MTNMDAMVVKAFGEKSSIKNYMQEHKHTHSKESGHSHSHTPTNFGLAFGIAIGLNLIFVVIELFYGFVSNSTALIADATHNFGDVIGLVLAYGSYLLAKKIPNSKYTYGLKSSTILATIVSGILLLVATGSIIWEAIQRFIEPAPIVGITVFVVASIGIFINSVSAFLLSRGGKDINIKSAFLHLVADAMVSVGVVIAGLIIMYTGYAYVDPIVSLIIAGVIIYSSWGLFREAVKLSLQAVPQGIDLQRVKKFLNSYENIKEVHDLHIWAISTSEVALTCHILLKDEQMKLDLNRLSHALEHEFEINHATIQVESESDKEKCKLESDYVV